jgi:protein SCO1
LTTTFRTSIAALCLVALAACDGAAPKFRSTDISGVDYGKSLELTDHNGKLRRLEAFRGKAASRTAPMSARRRWRTWRSQ